MREPDWRSGALSSHVDLEERVPASHPLRGIRAIANEAPGPISETFKPLYVPIGRPSIRQKLLRRALLLHAFCGIRSERLLMERFELDLLFRWFVGLGVDDPVWGASSLSKTRGRRRPDDPAQGLRRQPARAQTHRGVLRLGQGGRRPPKEQIPRPRLRSLRLHPRRSRPKPDPPPQAPRGIARRQSTWTTPKPPAPSRKPAGEANAPYRSAFSAACKRIDKPTLRRSDCARRRGAGMRVKITHEEVRTGFPFRRVYHEVHLVADFTHEEKQIVRQRYLEDQVLMERWPADAKPDDYRDWYALRVRHLFERRPDRFRAANPAEAKQYAAALVGVLREMKAWLEANAEPAGTTLIEF